MFEKNNYKNPKKNAWQMRPAVLYYYQKERDKYSKKGNENYEIQSN